MGGSGGEAGRTESVIGRLTALVGLVTGAVTIVYGAGAAVYWAALSNRDVPSNLAIATSLPREFLIGTGLLFVALPIALTALLLFALTPILVKATERGQWIVATVLVLGGVTLIWAVQPGSVFEFGGAILGAGLTVAILTALLATLVEERSVTEAELEGERELRRQALVDTTAAREMSPDESAALRAIDQQRLESDAVRAVRRQRRDYLAGVALAVIIAWGVLIGTARTDLPPAKLCTTDGGAYPGFLIGETGARVYVGESASDEEGRGGGKRQASQIISAPIADVAKLFIGNDLAACEPSSGRKEEGSTAKR